MFIVIIHMNTKTYNYIIHSISHDGNTAYVVTSHNVYELIIIMLC